MDAGSSPCITNSSVQARSDPPPVNGTFRGDLAQAACAPGCAARSPTTPTPSAATEPDAAESDAATTSEAAATTATAAAAAAAATEAAAPTAATSAATAAAATMAAAATTAASQLHAAANVFLIENIERGETDVGHFLFAENEALIGRVIVGLRDVGGGHRGCGCTTQQRKTQSGGTERLHAGGFGFAFLLRSLLDPWHGRILRRFL
jgi:hypothetical protein